MPTEHTVPLNAFKSHSLCAALAAAFCLLITVGLQAQTLYVSDYSTGLITALPLGGGSSTFATAPGGSQPEGMAFDSAGNLYVALAATNTIWKYTPGGVGSLFGTTLITHPTGLAFDSAGNLYASMTNNGTIEKFGPGGGTSTVFATGFGSVLGLAIDGANNVYGANYAASPGGSIFRVGPGGGAATAIASTLNYPNSLAFDGAGNLYATIGGTTGINEYAAGTWTPAVFYSPIAGGPTAIVFDPGSATFFVSMINTGQIERYALNGTDLGVFAGGFVSASSLAISAVPEPATYAALCGLGALGFTAWRKRRITV
ncbi:MAG: PEP-CTERM sorting domain-containing protein [bacterium]|nr:PEP-CTERM sorting domain-containing protein [bacterium]MDI1337520.1 PEP-CTERM sorting domain-containing protein [Lacunisphaera sp.]